MAAKEQASGIADGVTAYLAAASPEGQDRYARVRAEVRAQVGAGRVSERLSYRMPTFFVDGRVLLHVGLWADHLALYPVPEAAADAALAEDLAGYRKGKGTLHFPYARAWPAELVARVVAAHAARVG